MLFVLFLLFPVNGIALCIFVGIIFSLALKIFCFLVEFFHDFFILKLELKKTQARIYALAKLLLHIDPSDNASAKQWCNIVCHVEERVFIVASVFKIIPFKLEVVFKPVALLDHLSLLGDVQPHVLFLEN